MLTTNPFDTSDENGDKLREECGVFGVSGSESAAALVALGLHALQHRGQEAAGITSFDGHQFHTHRAMGHVAGNFDRDDVIRALPGTVASGHVRYSTSGETALRKQGASEEKAARIANAKAAGTLNRTGEKLDDRTVKDLRAEAAKIGIEGRSRMNKAALVKAIRGHG